MRLFDTYTFMKMGAHSIHTRSQTAQHASEEDGSWGLIRCILMHFQ